MSLKSVNVPEQMVPLFEQAEKYVKNYFASYESNNTDGTLSIGGERYILVRAKSLRVNFEKHIGDVLGLPEDLAQMAAENFLYMLARSLGQEDAKHFYTIQHIEDPVERLAAGPIHFNYSGWAYVDILPESKLSPDENCFIVYDHPYSFECDSFLTERGATSESPVCVMNAGYSAGWCSESFGIELDAREILCRAKGDQVCRFVMGVKTTLSDYEQWALEHIK